MNGFVGVTDNDWFAYVILLKQVWSKAQGARQQDIVGQSLIVKFHMNKLFGEHHATHSTRPCGKRKPKVDPEVR